MAAAVPLYRQVVAADPTHAEGHYLLGTALFALDQISEAVASLETAARLAPGCAELHHFLAAALWRQSRLDEAISALERALRLNPEASELREQLNIVRAVQENERGNRLDAEGDLDSAAAAYQRAVELNPACAEADNNLGFIRYQQGRFDEAADCWRRAIAAKPGLADAHQNLGVMLVRQGEPAEACSHFQQALESKPDFAAAHSGALRALQYRPGVDWANLATAHREFAERHAVALSRACRPHDNVRDPARRLRLGFVSGDFGCHPVGYFLVRALENLDRQKFQVLCYSDVAKDDPIASRLYRAATEWRDVASLDDAQLAERIREDRIDIAFDLTGHAGNNRLLTFARRPAPLAITWIGYVGTTGLTAIDYLLADRYQVPESAEAHIQEQVLRMPDGYVCFDPPQDAPPVFPLPAERRGYVTFGNFNHPAKLTAEMVEVWAAILRRVGKARLVLKYDWLERNGVARRIAGYFARQGIGDDLLELRGGSERQELLRQYADVDLALDPLPYNGGLTTCEALWMGVPVVTCPGATFAGRHSLSHLSNAGLTETIARDLDEYVELAVSLARDVRRLAAIRARLRTQMAASPLCDGPRFAANLMSVLRQAWQNWCASTR